jgi:hypothetical protein
MTANMNIVEKYIDCCIINGSHYDVSLACVEILKDQYKYIGNNTWKYFKDNDWHTDDKQMNLKFAIRTIVCNAFIQRSLFWDFKSTHATDMNIAIDDKFRANRLLTISSKLKEDKYISTIIKESKQFFTNEPI